MLASPHSASVVIFNIAKRRGKPRLKISYRKMCFQFSCALYVVLFDKTSSQSNMIFTMCLESGEWESRRWRCRLQWNGNWEPVRISNKRTMRKKDDESGYRSYIMLNSTACVFEMEKKKSFLCSSNALWPGATLRTARKLRSNGRQQIGWDASFLKTWLHISLWLQSLWAVRRSISMRRWRFISLKSPNISRSVYVRTLIFVLATFANYCGNNQDPCSQIVNRIRLITWSTFTHD